MNISILIQFNQNALLDTFNRLDFTIFICKCKHLNFFIYKIKIKKKFQDQNIGKFLKIDCKPNEKYFLKNCSYCYVKPKNRTVALLDLQFFLIKKAYEVSATIQLFKKESQTFHPFLINVKVDLCRYLKTKAVDNVIVRLILNFMLPSTNINHTCPYEGLVEVRNMDFYPDWMPSVWPSEDYKIVFHFFVNKDTTPAIITTVYLEIKNKNRIQF